MRTRIGWWQKSGTYPDMARGSSPPSSTVKSPLPTDFNADQGAGHVNSFTVDYVTQNLPRILRRNLGNALAALRNDAGLDAPYANVVPRVLREAVVYVDEQIYYDLIDALPLNWEIAPPEVLVNHFASDTHAFQCAARCLGGCTVALSLTDPARRTAWVAALGGKAHRVLRTKQYAHTRRCVSVISPAPYVH